MNQKYWAVDGNSFLESSTLLEKIMSGNAFKPFESLKGKRGLLFSNKTLNEFIEDELKHDNFALSSLENRSIRTFSSGEQKKALLNYLLSQKPDFLILESIFDMLDKKSQSTLLSELKFISKQLPIIQIFRRKEEILPFITNILRFNDNKIEFSGTIADYQSRYKVNEFSLHHKSIPPTPGEYKFFNNPLIQFKDVSVNYGEKPILNSINWKINNGDFWQLIGANGTGKTTLLTMLTGDNPKAYGQDITLFGTKKGSGESIWEIKKKIGYITPSMTVLFNGRHTVANMVISGLYDSVGLYEKPSLFEQKLANQWLNLIGMGKDKDVWFEQISEQKQYLVLIVRAMIKHPPLLILDEPTRGLDDYNASMLVALVNKIANESNTSIIYVSHKDEKGLKPKKIFQLTMTKNGSVGYINTPLN